MSLPLISKEFSNLVESANVMIYKTDINGNLTFINPTGENSGKSRISLPLFLHPRSEVVLSEQHTQASYLLERLKELGVK